MKIDCGNYIIITPDEHSKNLISGEKEYNHMIAVSREEFENFIKSYPRKLEKDWYMDWFSYNDFTLGNWPGSMVAMKSDGSYNVQIEYKIMSNYQINKNKKRP